MEDKGSLTRAPGRVFRPFSVLGEQMVIWLALWNRGVGAYLKPASKPQPKHSPNRKLRRAAK